MLFTSVVFASAFAAVATAQTVETSSASSVAASSTVSQSMPPVATAGFNIGNITTSMLFQWCLGQTNTCPEICGGAAAVNQCEESTLQYSCVCPNGTVPDVTAYINTIPFYECQATFVQCIAAHPNDAEGQATCTNNEQCGSRNATAELVSQSSAAAASTASSTASSSGSMSATASTTSATASNVAAMATYTNGAFAAMLMAAFKFLL